MSLSAGESISLEKKIIQTKFNKVYVTVIVSCAWNIPVYVWLVKVTKNVKRFFFGIKCQIRLILNCDL